MFYTNPCQPSNKPLHLEHAYASTVHSSQGLSNDRVLIALDTKSRTTSMNLYYVAISRARQEARVYTNNRGELPAAIARRFDKTTALGLERNRNTKRDRQALQRNGAADGKAIKPPAHKSPELTKKPPTPRQPRQYGRFQ
ncbi:ATP-binding domain-containing protein [Xanthomonas cassavae CFBP 4642]|uniref:ATP-binding domain-containing protein n=1 Tax=Xanthomonas cassavae CFBP 4642 TaxID=1219375 RepID=A0ABS8HKI4_9XANT|nr:ATP-binding domain-containing protein [Xanthomonas cassavae CFBP 4642]